MERHQVLIIGGGNAGISVAAQLLRKRPKLDVAIVEPSEKHYYQPAWTLVGGGDYDVQKTVRPEASVMPKKAKWIKDRAEAFEPENQVVHLASGKKVAYDFMVVCPGIQLRWEWVEGLEETLGKNGVASNYRFDLAPYTFECIRNFKGGVALFTNPATPIKCGGAPQKIMYLACDYWRKHGILGKADVHFCTAGGVIFGVKKYADTLMKVVNRYGIHLDFKHNLVAIDGARKEATFEVTQADGSKEKKTMHFDMIHVTPPQSAPDFIRNSPLADANGWVDVNKHTLQHTKYPNIFGIGDATNTPNAKTGAAIRKQAPILVQNLLEVMDGKQPFASYNGYGSCPLVTGYGKLVLAEFDYDNNPIETFPFDQSKERWTMYQLKKHILPWLYWNKILKGTA
ncbi:sulfide:quinone oxidoreductase [Thermonema lapsum]|uniref:Sulfide:quinone oxidoreductase n=1 Tax=Thermonema lapsum TaxID=28195 RepID=A0A846MSX2_9BACT|nr:FAD/NAD(P)-binding oxidoreductase [Thermonema lapsum]NIK74734.1 sulfide:quinone oxidoreductase [Thermonema lapsum]